MKNKTGILSKIYMVLIMLFLYAPIAVLIFYSFNNGKTTVWKGFTLKWYSELFRDSNIINSLGNTLIIAFLASIFATILGTAAAIGISNFKGKKKTDYSKCFKYSDNQSRHCNGCFADAFIYYSRRYI